jgi:hypothetical protein
MQGRRRSGDEPQHEIDGGIVGRRARNPAAVELDLVGLEHVGVAHAIAAIDGRPLGYDRDTIETIERRPHARLREPPLGQKARRLAGLAQLQRPAKFADQQSRLIDLPCKQSIRGLERKRRRHAGQLRARVRAAHLDAERKAPDRLRAAAEDAAGFRLVRAPVGDRVLCLS